MKFFLPFLAIVLTFSSCSKTAKKEVLKEEFKRPSSKPIPQKEAIQVVHVKAQDFFIDSTKIPKNTAIKQVKIIGASMVDVISLLTEATGESIVFQLQSEVTSVGEIAAVDGALGLNQNARNYGVNGYNNGYNNIINGNETLSGSRLLTDSNVYVSASNISIGRFLQRSVGDKMSISYSDDTYYLGFTRTVTLKIPSISTLGDSLKDSLRTMGAANIVYDKVTSSITFTARQKEYKSIMQYLDILRKNIYVIEYEMEIYSVDLKDNFSLGIDWSVMPKALSNSVGLVVKSAASAGAVGATALPYQIGVVASTNHYDASAMVNALDYFGKVESIQRPTLLGLAGTDVKLKDGVEESYIKEIQTTTIPNSGFQTSTVNATALSGLDITLNSNIMDGTVVTSIALKIDDIVGYTDFQVDGNKYYQPKVSTKEVTNIMRVQPGVPIIISGLFRKKSDKGHSGIPGTDGTILNNVTGTDYSSQKKSEMVIVVTPRLIKYVMD